MSELEQGEPAVCSNCERTRPIQSVVTELPGAGGIRVAYGPGGRHEQYVERDGEVLCYTCNSDTHTEGPL